jgi:hypothetical protein
MFRVTAVAFVFELNTRYPDRSRFRWEKTAPVRTEK